MNYLKFALRFPLLLVITGPMLVFVGLFWIFQGPWTDLWDDVQQVWTINP